MNYDIGKHLGRLWKWQARNPRSTALTAGILVGGTAVILAERAARSKPGAEPEPTAAPPPASPSAETARSGATLTVKTPRGQAGTLRAAPGLASAVLGYLPSGTTVQVLSTSMSGDRPPKRWYQVQPPTGRDGWMHGDILT